MENDDATDGADVDDDNDGREEKESKVEYSQKSRTNGHCVREI